MFKITPTEAVELVSHTDTRTLLMAIRICNAYKEQERHLSPSDIALFSYGACLNAGIVEGVRRERAKKKKAHVGVGVSKKANTIDVIRDETFSLLQGIISEKTLLRIYKFVERLHRETVPREETPQEHIDTRILWSPDKQERARDCEKNQRY